MGQGLACYECIWHSQCYSNVGCSIGLGICSLWLCIPNEIRELRGPEMIKMGSCDQGWGSSFFCQASYCLIPDWLRNFSKWQSIGERRGPLYNVNIRELGGQVHGYGGQQQFGGQPQFGGQQFGGQVYNNPPPGLGYQQPYNQQRY